jgi:hypothetical protein
MRMDTLDLRTRKSCWTCVHASPTGVCWTSVHASPTGVQTGFLCVTHTNTLEGYPEVLLNLPHHIPGPTLPTINLVDKRSLLIDKRSPLIRFC